MTYPTYSKYTFVCTGDCDALIEYTFKDGLGWPNGVVELTCPCGSKCTYLSVQDATIRPTNQTKEEKMETTFGATMTQMSDVDVLKDLRSTFNASHNVTMQLHQL